MSWGRVIGAAAASAAVGGCALVAVGMSRAQSAPDAVATTLPSRSVTYPRYAAQLPVLAGSTAASSSAGATPTPTPSSTAVASSSHAAATTSAPAPPASKAAPSTRSTSAAPRPRATSAAPQRGVALPLSFSTGSATRVITVTAPSSGSTTAWLQPWVKAPGGGWLKYGSGITAHVGSDGLSWQPSEFKSATPIGSFTLTRAFGALSNPGTPLPYTQTNPSYWWISQDDSLYNTMQSCWSNCPFDTSSTTPNEHLYYETPYYNYAVVINTPSGSSAYPHGSAFFLHVTDGNPTAGCVAIPQWRLLQIMRWLTPAAHPRILIGVT